MPTALSEDAIRAELETDTHLSNWRLDNSRLVRQVRYTSYKEALRGVQTIGELAERMDHHPDLVLSYTNLMILLQTHAANNQVTELDLEAARRIEDLLP